MPVTELAWIPSATPGCIPEALLTAGRKGMMAQSEWAAEHASSTLPSGPPAVRGAALYQQLEDRGVMLVTAHWDSLAQHAECIASRENKLVMASMEPHIRLSEVKIMHVEGVYMFGGKTLDAGFLSVMRVAACIRDESQRLRFEAAWDHVKKLLFEKEGFEHLGGWRIEKDTERDDGRDEFVVVGAWRDEDALRSCNEGDGIGLAWKDVAMDVDVKTYCRVA